MKKVLLKEEIQKSLTGHEAWVFDEVQGHISKEFTFKSYLKTIAFVNALAWIANKENHHPDLIVSFNKCKVILTSHDEGGVTNKDITLALLTDLL